YRSNFGGNLGLEWAEGQQLDIQTFYSRINGGYDSAVPFFNDRGIQTLDATSITSRNRISDLWSSTLSVGLVHEKNETNAAPSQGGQGYFESHQTQYQWLNTFELAKGHALNVGIERLEQSA